MIEQPVKQALVYSEKPPKGEHCVKIWRSEKVKGRYSFSIAFGEGVMGAIPGIEKDSLYRFGCYESVDEAMSVARSVIKS